MASLVHIAAMGISIPQQFSHKSMNANDWREKPIVASKYHSALFPHSTQHVVPTVVVCTVGEETII